MNLLSIENLTKSYSEKILFNNISLGINEGDKIGIIGINGTGKSTLLKVISGFETADEGRIVKANKASIEYLSQNPNFDDNASILEQIFKGNSSIMVLLREYENILEKLNSNPDDASLQKQLMILSSKMDAEGAWDIESEAKTILSKLGISNFQAKIGTLSGGQRKRVALASTLINPADLLILDEPTNHLDNDTIEWLEKFLNKRKGALLMITHDRYFLDRITNKILELDKGNLYSYKGNYSDFLEKKSERLEIQTANESKRQNLYRKELAWIRRGAKARSTKQKARIDRFEELSSNKPDLNSSKIDISSVSSRLGKKIIEIENVSKSFNDTKIIDDFSYILLRDDRIGIVGLNGTGKSTLMNLIYGKLSPDSGEIEKGETVKIGYYSQETSHMDDNQRVIEYIKETAEFLPTSSGEKITASQMLERFLFTPSEQWTFIGKLSGGERRRLYLLKVLMDAPNILLLDEPTNDLDIETLTILEDYIDNFQGAVISVSHDRYFLDKIAEKIFAFEGKGKIAKYNGNYSDYNESIKSVEETTSNNSVSSIKKKSKPVKKKPLKFTFKEQFEFNEIDQVIETIENSISDIENQINNAGSDYELLQKLVLEKEKSENELEEKMNRWSYLNELAEKIEKSKLQ
jgi:ABC transport system ATP-binding/permease protein